MVNIFHQEDMNIQLLKSGKVIIPIESFSGRIELVLAQFLIVVKVIILDE